MKNIFLISELFYPNKTSTAYIMTEIAKHLADRNKVTAICADIAYDANVSIEKDPDMDKINIIATKSPKVDKNKLTSRIFGSLYSAMAFGRIVSKKVKKGDTVFAVTNPFLLVLMLGVIRVFKSFDYVLLVHDVFPENAVPAGMTNPNGMLYKLSKKVYDWAYSKADRLIVLGRDMKDLVDTKIGKSKPVFIGENWYDKELDPNVQIDRNAYLGRDVRGKTVVGFAGNIGRVQNLKEFLIQFAEAQNDNLVVAIVGHGAVEDEIKAFIAEMQLENVIYLGPKPRDEQSTFLNCFDIGLITLAPGMYGLGVPSKTYNLLAMAKPVLYIGDENSEIDLLIDETKAGWTFSWNETEALVHFLKKLDAVDPSMKLAAQKLAMDKYNYEMILSKIGNIITNEN